MPKRCDGNAEQEQQLIAGHPDVDITRAVASHADPEWWKKDYVQKTNQAYLRRYGSYLRREARRRGLM